MKFKLIILFLFSFLVVSAKEEIHILSPTPGFFGGIDIKSIQSKLDAGWSVKHIIVFSNDSLLIVLKISDEVLAKREEARKNAPRTPKPGGIEERRMKMLQQKIEEDKNSNKN